MSRRFSGRTKDITYQGSPIRTKELVVVTYKHFRIEFTYFKLIKLFLMSIFNNSIIAPQPILEFLLEPEALGGRGLKKFAKTVINLLIAKEKGNDKLKGEIADMYNCTADSISEEQLKAYKYVQKNIL